MGNPKPKKSRAVRVVIEPATKNGKLAIIIGNAFGSRWRKMMRRWLAPKALAERIKSKFLNRRNSALTKLAICIQPNIERINKR